MTVRDHLGSSRILAVFRLNDSSPDPVPLAKRLVAAGITAVECTMDSPHAVETIRHLRRALDSSVIIGAGTVTKVEQVDSLASAGASFIVSPHTDEALIERAGELAMEAIPGVLSPTDIHKARTAGASILKLFPAAPLGVDYLRVVRAPFPDVDWIPTGGISLHNAAAWLEAGALCVGVGSALWTAADPEADIRRLLAGNRS